MPDREFEKVKVGDLLPGIICSVQEDPEHLFKGFKDKEKGTVNPDVTCQAVRFIFLFDDYQEKHYGRWEKKNYGAKSNLYKKYIEKLVDNAKPDQKFDIQLLDGMPVKVLWSEKNNFQNVDMVLPLKDKLTL